MKKANMKIAFNLLEQPTLYGPPPDEVYKENNVSIDDSEVIYSQLQENEPQSVPLNANTSRVLNATSIGIWIVLFIFGIIAILNKKLSNIAKAIIISAIVVVGLVITIFIKQL